MNRITELIFTRMKNSLSTISERSESSSPSIRKDSTSSSSYFIDSPTVSNFNLPKVDDIPDSLIDPFADEITYIEEYQYTIQDKNKFCQKLFEYGLSKKLIKKLCNSLSEETFSVNDAEFIIETVLENDEISEDMDTRLIKKDILYILFESLD